MAHARSEPPVLVSRPPAAARAASTRPAARRRKATALEAARLASYRLFGRHLEAPRPRLHDHLVRAGFAVSPGMYLGMQFAAALCAFVAVSVLAGLGFYGLMGLVGAAYGVLAGAVAGGAACVAFPFVLKSRIQNRSRQLDGELPFALSELSVLAGIGLSPIVLIRRMAARPHDPGTTAEFRRIIAMVDTEGRDLSSSMSEVARSTASEALRTTLWDMANLMHQGGDLETYLHGQSATVLDEVRASQKSFTDQLGTYADMYITIVLMGVMFLSVGAFMVDAFQSTMGPLTAAGLLQLLTFGFVPLIVAVLGIILNSAHGRSEG